MFWCRFLEGGLGSIAVRSSVSRLSNVRPQKTVREAATSDSNTQRSRRLKARPWMENRVLKTAGAPSRNSCLGPRQQVSPFHSTTTYSVPFFYILFLIFLFHTFVQSAVERLWSLLHSTPTFTFLVLSCLLCSACSAARSLTD